MFVSERVALRKKVEFMMEQTEDIEELEKLTKIRDGLALVNADTFKELIKVVGGTALSIAILKFEKTDVITTKAFNIGTKMMD